MAQRRMNRYFKVTVSSIAFRRSDTGATTILESPCNIVRQVCVAKNDIPCTVACSGGTAPPLTRGTLLKVEIPTLYAPHLSYSGPSLLTAEEQIREERFQAPFTYPKFIPELNLHAITHLELNIFLKLGPESSNSLPDTTTKDIVSDPVTLKSIFLNDDSFP
uniref:Uncharacterized protein n=1 Tax=Solanum tuberosum TaxID=4113 RepID=M1D147_SOLTU